MIQDIVKNAVNCIDGYKIERELEKYELLYSTGRLEVIYGAKHAMVALNAHLDKYYEVLPQKPELKEYRKMSEETK